MRPKPHNIINYDYRRHKGRVYDTCINLDLKGNYGSRSWCSTSVDVNGVHIAGQESLCPDDCPLTNCPIGFYWAAAEGTCYQVINFVIKLLYIQVAVFNK